MLSGSRQGKERRASPCIAAFVTVEAEVQDGIRVTLLNDVYSDGAALGPLLGGVTKRRRCRVQCGAASVREQGFGLTF